MHLEGRTSEKRNPSSTKKKENVKEEKLPGVNSLERKKGTV